jgi:membrane protein YqaA with SNARE-associated domain
MNKKGRTRGWIASLKEIVRQGFFRLFGPEREKTVKKSRLYKYIPLLTLVLVIAITVLLLIYREAMTVLGNWGYLGAFFIGLVGNATVFLPVPSLLLLFALGASFNPVLIGLTGAAGGTLGELSGYILGLGGHVIIRNNRLYLTAENWMKKWGSAAIFIFALAPVLPIDVAGIVAGALRFPVWKFLSACFAGKALLYIGLTLATAWGWQWVERLFA